MSVCVLVTRFCRSETDEPIEMPFRQGRGVGGAEQPRAAGVAPVLRMARSTPS